MSTFSIVALSYLATCAMVAIGVALRDSDRREAWLVTIIELTMCAVWPVVLFASIMAWVMPRVGQFKDATFTLHGSVREVKGRPVFWMARGNRALVLVDRRKEEVAP